MTAQERVILRLKHIIGAIDDIEMISEHGIEDKKTYYSIIYLIQIIGEAANRILKLQPGIEITDIRKIVTRNRIIHGYDSVTDDVIWTIVVKYIPVLGEEIAHLLQ